MRLGVLTGGGRGTNPYSITLYPWLYLQLHMLNAATHTPTVYSVESPLLSPLDEAPGKVLREQRLDFCKVGRWDVFCVELAQRIKPLKVGHKCESFHIPVVKGTSKGDGLVAQDVTADHIILWSSCLHIAVVVVCGQSNVWERLHRLAQFYAR